MTSNRDRASGWKHAKLTGHKNEANIEGYLNQDNRAFSDLCFRLLAKKDLKGRVIVGGLKETNVDSVLNNRTKSKTDMKLYLDDSKGHINISIKKSLAGQVYLIKASRFINGFEEHFKVQIPDEVKKGIMLFWGEDSEIREYIEKFGEKENIRIKDYEERKQRLVSDSLKRYNENIAKCLIDWFKDNIYQITLFCFSRGLSKDREDWADYIWYKNLINDEKSIDGIFSIEDIGEKMKSETKLIDFGKRNGGTTIKLPFGFVQWHQKQMQFHHKYKLIVEKCDFK